MKGVSWNVISNRIIVDKAFKLRGNATEAEVDDARIRIDLGIANAIDCCNLNFSSKTILLINLACGSNDSFDSTVGSCYGTTDISAEGAIVRNSQLDHFQLGTTLKRGPFLAFLRLCLATKELRKRSATVALLHAVEARRFFVLVLA